MDQIPDGRTPETIGRQLVLARQLRLKHLEPAGELRPIDRQAVFDRWIVVCGEKRSQNFPEEDLGQSTGNDPNFWIARQSPTISFQDCMPNQRLIWS
jgi:hypothetical protein